MNTVLKHSLAVGTQIKLTDYGPIGRYDGTDADLGVIVALTYDENTPTYAVKFENGDTENHLYRDEFEPINTEESK